MSRTLFAGKGDGLQLPAESLAGRDKELALIGEFLDRVVATGDAMLVTGEAGVGKTALLHAAAEQAVARGCRVLRASGVEFEADIPFAGLHQLLLPLAEDFDQLRDAHRMALNVALGFGAGPVPDRLLVCNAALTAVRHACQAGPLLIVVDDLQWLDRASAPVLGFLARRFTGITAGLLGASRTDAEGFFERSGLDELEVRPLDEVSAGRLVSAKFPLLSPRSRHRLLAEARGNPLALIELPQALSGHGTGEHGHAFRDHPATVLPLSRRLQRIYVSRLRLVPETTRAALLMMALAGTGDARLTDMIIRQHDWTDLNPAELAGLVELVPGTHRLAFGHPLMRAAVVELATAAERREAHQRLAGLMSDQPDRHAWHLGEAAADPDEYVAALLQQSAHSMVRRGDSVSAVAALIRSAELSPAAHDQARRLAGAAYLGTEVTGDLRDAEALLAAARRAHPDLEASVEAAHGAALVLLNGDGDVSTAHRLLIGAMQAAEGQEISPVTIEQALRALDLVCYFGGRADLWKSFESQLARLGPGVPADRRPKFALVADVARSHGAPLDGLDAEIGTLARVADSNEVVRIAGAAVFVDRLPGCRQALRRVARVEQDAGAVTSVIYADTLLAFEAYQTGQWDEAQRLAEAAADLCATLGYHLLRWSAQGVKAFVAAARGETAVARALSDEIRQWAGPRGVRAALVEASYACLLAALAESDFETAYQEAVSISPAGQLVPYEPHAPWAMLDLVEAALRTGRSLEAAAHVQAMRQSGVQKVSSRLALLATAAEALTTPDAESVRLFDQALAIAGVEQWPFDLARVQLLYGERLRRTKEMTQARLHLTAAAQAFDRLGARRWAERAALELRATGQARRGEQFHHEALTPQELEIAMLAASGLSNKEIGGRLFLSHRTVGAHLYRIFPKLGITSRAALRDALPDQPVRH
jgi:DNA-binding CsgD family transcriptional regulator